MSLMSSIFGGAPSAPSSADDGREAAVGSAAKDDLFSSKVPTPPAAPAGPKKPAKEKKDKKSDETRDDDDDDGSSSSDSASQQDAPQDKSSQTKDGDDKGNDVDNDNRGSTRKKTKEELDEEESRTVFVGNLPPDIGRRSLANMFKSCGKVASARLRSLAVAGVKLPPDQAGNQNMMRKVCANTGKILADAPCKSAQGYVLFESVDSVEKALELNGTVRGEHTIRVDRANPTNDPSRSVFVGNLPYGADEETLRAHFMEGLGGEAVEGDGDSAAVVAGVRIVRDRETRKCRGFGYVALRDATLVPAALGMHGSTCMGRELRVMVCGKRARGGGSGRRGNDSGGAKSGRSFEGRRATETSAGGKAPGKRKSVNGTTSGGGSGTAKKRRARSEKKAGPGGAAKSGVSKRAATEQKVNKRVKKLQQRATKGMGKKKH